MAERPSDRGASSDENVASRTSTRVSMTEARSESDASSTTILIADDDDAFRETVRLWLVTDGRWTVREASDGREALEKLDATVDVLVLDRKMPALSGLEVVRRYDETPFDGEILVLSAFEPDEHLGADAVTDYVIKPIVREEFVDRLEKLVGF